MASTADRPAVLSSRPSAAGGCAPPSATQSRAGGDLERKAKRRSQHRRHVESANLDRASRTPRWLIEAAQRGDPAAERELLRRYEPLVQRVVWKLRLPPGCDREDLAQEARVGLAAAIREWQPKRGPFPAFADRCASNQALLALESECRRKHQLLSRAVSLDACLGGARSADAGRPITLLDVLPAPGDARTDPEARLLVREQLSSVLACASHADDQRAHGDGGIAQRPQLPADDAGTLWHLEGSRACRLPCAAQARRRAALRRLSSPLLRSTYMYAA